MSDTETGRTGADSLHTTKGEVTNHSFLAMPLSGNDVPSSYAVSYCGVTVLDFNFSAASFRWVVGELSELLPFGQQQIELTIRNSSSGKTKVVGSQKRDDKGTKLIVLEHDVDYVWKFFVWPDNGCCFAYLVRTDPDYPYTCHVFSAQNSQDVSELLPSNAFGDIISFQAKEIVSSLRSAVQQRKNALNALSLETSQDMPKDPMLQSVPFLEVPPSSHLSSSAESLVGNEKIDSFASQFEVLYLCRVEIRGSAPSSAIVDEAARRYDEEYRTAQARQYVAASVKRLMGAGRTSYDDSGVRSKPSSAYYRCLLFFTTYAVIAHLRFSDAENEDAIWEEPSETQQDVGLVRRRRRTSSLMIEALVDSVFLDETSSPSSVLGRKKSISRQSSWVASPSLADMMKTRASSNRSMLMSIGRHDVNLISLDHKQKLLVRRLTEISCVIQVRRLRGFSQDD